jgi:hypothetical protein
VNDVKTPTGVIIPPQRIRTNIPFLQTFSFANTQQAFIISGEVLVCTSRCTPQGVQLKFNDDDGLLVAIRPLEPIFIPFRKFEIIQTALGTPSFGILLNLGVTLTYTTPYLEFLVFARKEDFFAMSSIESQPIVYTMQNFPTTVGQDGNAWFAINHHRDAKKISFMYSRVGSPPHPTYGIFRSTYFNPSGQISYPEVYFSSSNNVWLDQYVVLQAPGEQEALTWKVVRGNSAVPQANDSLQITVI